ELTENIAAAGSFLDGGANNPLQKAAEEIISREAIEQETKAIQSTFKPKRDFMIASLEKLGFKIVGEARGAFYIWASVENLDEKINTGDKFFEACLREKVIVVPGKFFDLNPGKVRTEKRFENLVRFSYGPAMKTIEKGMEAVGRVVNL
ncbi:MAG: aminotransferase class I/II-fold pyridoxal phosphate-dependent enzyme, partial [Candidatus Magasanikbacteria bacterium]|nr:aminotransferase class I/II-fold pyridoxal phosphate-dependent enzyme [Candidatus Magasanikbacteria bacterium]